MCRDLSSETSSLSILPPSTSGRDRNYYPTKINEAAQQGDAALAENLLKEMHGEYNKTKEDKFKVTTKVFNMVLNAWMKSPSKEQAPQRADAILERMWDLHKINQFDTKPDCFSYNSVMSCWARSGQKEAVERTEALFQEMKEFWNRGEADWRPNTITYNIAMSAYAKLGRTKEAEALLEEMYVDYTTNGNTKAKPNVFAFNTVLNAWSKSRSQDAPERAESILTRMEELYKSGKLNVKPDRVSYNCVIDCWSNSSLVQAPVAADAILERMWELHKVNQFDTKPDCFSYNSVMSCWARSGHKKAVERTEALFQEMKEFWKQGEADWRPKTITYNTAMSAYATVGLTEKAEAILEEHYLDYTNNGNEEAKPDVKSFNTILNAWSKSHSQDAPERAESILTRMEELYKSGKLNVKPDRVSYNCIINCWGNSKDVNATQKAASVLREMQEQWKSGDGGVRPDAVSYSATIHAFASKGQAKEAEALLEEMYVDYANNGNEEAKPNVISFNTVLNAWSKSRSKDAPERAELILVQMENLYLSGKLNVKPDRVSYNCVINCWSKSSLVQAPIKADAILRKMWKMYNDGQLVGSPNMIAYNGVIQSWSRSKHARRNTQGFKRMMELFDEMLSLAAKGNKSVAPSVITFNVLARGIPFDNELSMTEKSQLMEKLLCQMQENHVTPDDRTRDGLSKFYRSRRS